jgi:hypothetical protein
MAVKMQFGRGLGDFYRKPQIKGGNVSTLHLSEARIETSSITDRKRITDPSSAPRTATSGSGDEIHTRKTGCGAPEPNLPLRAIACRAATDMRLRKARRPAERTALERIHDLLDKSTIAYLRGQRRLAQEQFDSAELLARTLRRNAQLNN